MAAASWPPTTTSNLVEPPNANAAVMPNSVPNTSEPWRPIYRFLSIHLKPHMGQLKEIEIRKILKVAAKEFHKKNFSDFEFCNNSTACVIFVKQNELRKKIKITVGEMLANLENCLFSPQKNRGEACVSKRLSKIEGIVPLEYSFVCRMKEKGAVLKAEVFSYVEGEDLFDFIGKAEYPKDLAKVLFIAYSVVEMVQKIHLAQCAHRDLKMENIVVGLDGQAKLIDQTSLIYLPNSQETTSPRGSIKYFSSDKIWAIYGKGQTYRAFDEDRWSLGVLLHSLFTQSSFGVQYEEVDVDNFYQYLCKQWPKEGHLILMQRLRDRKIPEIIIEPLMELILGLMDPWPSKRMQLSIALELIEKIQKIYKDTEEP